jgi:hypothetical protein
MVSHVLVIISLSVNNNSNRSNMMMIVGLQNSTPNIKPGVKFDFKFDELNQNSHVLVDKLP